MTIKKKKTKKIVRNLFCVDCKHCIFDEIGVFWNRKTIYKCSTMGNHVTGSFMLCENARKEGEKCGIAGLLFEENLSSQSEIEDEQI